MSFALLSLLRLCPLPPQAKPGAGRAEPNPFSPPRGLHGCWGGEQEGLGSGLAPPAPSCGYQ